MSVYASIPGIDADTPTGPPWLYQGSHILPDEDDPRGGSISLAFIPCHITRDGRDDQPDANTPWPWLRLALDGLHTSDPAVVISPAQARDLAEQLTYWADEAQPRTAGIAQDADLVTLRDALGAVTGQCRALEEELVVARSALNRAQRDASPYWRCAHCADPITGTDWTWAAGQDPAVSVWDKPRFHADQADCQTAAGNPGQPQQPTTKATNRGCGCHNGDELCSGCRACPDVCQGCDGPNPTA